MQFRRLAEYFGRIETTPARNEKTAILAELLKALTSTEVAEVAYLSVGRLGPLYDPIEFGLAEKMVVRAVAWGTGVTSEEVTRRYKAEGDLGKVALQAVAGRESSLTITEVFVELTRIAREAGKGSQERKIGKLGKLVKETGGESAKYIVRLVSGKLRLGFSDLTILDALSWAVTGDKSDREALEQAYNVWSDMGEVARVYKAKGVAGLAELDVVPGRPVKPMRAERLGTIKEIVAKLTKFAVEPKFDGMRVQVHAFEREKDRGTQVRSQEGLFAEAVDRIEVKIFSRGLDDITLMFPDVVAEARRLQMRVGDLVLDGEAVGVDSTGGYLAFQETMKRKRKHDVTGKVSEIPLSVKIFDVLYSEGRGRLSEPYEERRRRLVELALSGIFEMAESTYVTTEGEAQELFNKYMKNKLEGMICKRPGSYYLAGARNFNWVKYKRVHEEGMVDTLDCVVMGYYRGRGKRNKFGVGAFLVGVRGEGEAILTVAKIGTGLTDEQFRELYDRLQKVKSDQPNKVYVVARGLTPDAWVRPEVIVEIQADEITKSPIHSAGYALRFPRLVKFRDDKKLADITSREEVKAMLGIYGVEPAGY